MSERQRLQILISLGLIGTVLLVAFRGNEVSAFDPTPTVQPPDSHWIFIPGVVYQIVEPTGTPAIPPAELPTLTSTPTRIPPRLP